MAWDPDLPSGLTETDPPQVTPDFPTLAPLAHDLPLLSPSLHPTFSVDDFLLSRAKAADISYIIADLKRYSVTLKEELVSIINQDYKDFVSLGSGLRSESHRIARLAWSNTSANTSVDAPDTSASTSTSTSTSASAPTSAAMATVRDTLLMSRDTLQEVQTQIKSCISKREVVVARKARLELMLQLQDSVVRLEQLLLISAPSRRRSSYSSDPLLDPQHHHNAQSYQGSFDSDSAAGSDYGLDSDFDHDHDDQDMDHHPTITSPTTQLTVLTDDNSLAKSPSPLGKPENHTAPLDSRPRHSNKRRLRRDGGVSLPRRHSSSATTPGSPTRSFAFAREPDVASSLLGLPQRIARTSAEFSRLKFLSKRVQDEGLTAFTDALQNRIEHIRTTLRQDLRALLKPLLASPSLLLNGRPAEQSGQRRSSAAAVPISPTLRRHKTNARDTKTDDLQSWSQIPQASPTDELDQKILSERRDEQREWLDMVLSTLYASGPVREIEDAVREIMIQPWAIETIHATALETDQPQSLPESLSQPAKSHLNDILLTESDADEPVALRELYNRILAFASVSAWQVCDAAERISAAAEAVTPCEIFVNALWDEIATRLMDTLGGSIFFVGRPEVFYKNYAISATFLQRFASLAPSARAHTALLRHPAWLAFRRRWPLPVYFQMRFREIVARLEEGLVAADAEQEGHLPGTVAIVAALRAPWKSGVHIHELAAREWRILLHILSRYKIWVDSKLPDDGDEPDVAFLVRLAADLDYVHEELASLFDSTIVPLITLDHDIAKELRTVLDDALAWRPALVARLGRIVIETMRTRCAEPLRLLRTAARTSFVPLLTAPLTEAPLPPTWTRAVLDDLLVKYTAALTTVNKNHESLRRLRRGGMSSIFSRETQDPTADKMRSQMQADLAVLQGHVKAILPDVDFAGWKEWGSLERAAAGSTDEA